jgi:hypothetical protein
LHEHIDPEIDLSQKKNYFSAMSVYVSSARWQAAVEFNAISWQVPGIDGTVPKYGLVEW